MTDPSSAQANEPQAPLSGIRILEFGGIGPGPFAGAVLAGMGAEVVRIDRPGGHPQLAADSSLLLGRSARIELDLKTPAGVDQALDLIRGVDAIYEGFRPGVMERLGLGPERCHELRPELVYARMTGWGQDGRYRHLPGHDINYLAATGLLETIGPREAPVPPVNFVADYGAGAMFLVSGILAALVQVDRTGKGSVVDAAMVDGAAMMFADLLDRLQGGDWVPERAANEYDGGAPFYRVYTTSDERHMAVGAIEPQFYGALLQTLNLDGLEVGAQHDRSRWPELEALISERFRSRRQAEWIDLFEGVEACVTPVLNWKEAVTDLHLANDRGTYVRGTEQWIPRPAPRFHSP